MYHKRGAGGFIRLLKFDTDESLDPKSLFDGAKLTMKSSTARKPSISEKRAKQHQPAQYERLGRATHVALVLQPRARADEPKALAALPQSLYTSKRGGVQGAGDFAQASQFEHDSEGSGQEGEQSAAVPKSVVLELADKTGAVLRRTAGARAAG